MDTESSTCYDSEGIFQLTGESNYCTFCSFMANVQTVMTRTFTTCIAVQCRMLRKG